MKVKFYGESDDLIEYSIDGKNDEIGDAAEEKRPIRVASIGGSRAVLIHPVYDGCWSFAVGLVEDGSPFPPWSFAIAREHPYSTSLEIDTGDDLVTVEKTDR